MTAPTLTKTFYADLDAAMGDVTTISGTVVFIDGHVLISRPVFTTVAPPKPKKKGSS